MFNVILVLVMIYLVLVLRVYSLTLYYSEFDMVRKYSLLAPFAFVRLFLYALTKKKYRIIKTCFVSRLPTTYVLIGLQYCLLQKEYECKKNIIKRSIFSFKFSFNYESNKDKLEIKTLFEKTEKFICQC